MVEWLNLYQYFDGVCLADNELLKFPYELHMEDTFKKIQSLQTSKAFRYLELLYDCKITAIIQ